MYLSPGALMAAPKLTQVGGCTKFETIAKLPLFQSTVASTTWRKRLELQAPHLHAYVTDGILDRRLPDLLTWLNPLNLVYQGYSKSGNDRGNSSQSFSTLLDTQKISSA